MAFDGKGAGALRDNPKRGFIATLADMAEHAERQAVDGKVRVAALVDELDERAFGLLIFVLALPCLVPGLPGAQLIAIAILLLAAQLVFGRVEPWLPNWFLNLRVSASWVRAMAEFAERRLRWAERVAHPRWVILASGVGERFFAVLTALAALTIMLPITNTIPSIGVALIAIGLIERDGLLIAVGGSIALAWVSLLTGLVVALATGAGFALDLAQTYAPWLVDWLGR